MDALDVPAHDHRMVEQLFRDYHAAASDAQRRAVVELLVRELSRHAALEELDRLDEGDARTDDLVARLRGDVEEHVRELETEFLPGLRAAVGQERFDALGRALVRAERTAPTRPHPNAPDRPPALTLAAPVAAAYDRVRDRLQGRPRT